MLDPGLRSLCAPFQASFPLPCFYFSKSILLLPAFGEFAGLGLMEVEPGEACFAVVDNLVVQVPG